MLALTEVERFFKVLGDDTRLRILQAIGEEERSVSEILTRTRLPQTLASFHLRVLREAGVLSTARRGPFIYYRLADCSLLNLLEACAKYAETLIESGGQPEFRWPPFGRICRIMAPKRR